MTKATVKKAASTKEQPAPQLVNKMVLKGKRKGDEDSMLEIKLADDKSNVAGFGQPVTNEYAHKMVQDYCEDVLAAQRFIDRIKSDFANDRDFKKLKALMDRRRHIVSGVFGKEIILQILAQPRCEGIRYMFGKYMKKTTIILKGVAEVKEGSIMQNGEVSVAKSVPLDMDEMTNGARNRGTNVASMEASLMRNINGEVHQSSLTVADVLEASAASEVTPRRNGTPKGSGDMENALALAGTERATAVSARQMAKTIFGMY
jgi:hypothetical protein